MAHESLWRASADLPLHGPLASTLDVDAVVLGAGITGLTVALFLKRAGLRVAVLEAARIGAGVTGFTTAHLTEALDRRWYRFRKDFGHEGASLAASAQRAAIDQIGRLVEQERIDCSFQRVPGWLFAEDERGADEIEKEARATRDLGLSTALDEAPLPFAVKAALRFDNQAQFHPLRYLAAIARAVDGNGTQIFEESRALEIEDGEPCRVRTSGGTIRCHDVIVATNSPVNDRAILQTKLAQYRSYVLAARMNGPPLPGLFWDTKDPYHYLRAQLDSDDWFLIAGGADHKVGQVRDTQRQYEELRGWVRQRFPDIRQAGGNFAHEWSAQVVETVDGLPYIGRNPGQGHVWIGTGYSGNGMTNGTVAALLVSDLVLGRRNLWAELFDPSRIKPLASIKDWVKENVDYPVHFIGDRFTHAKEEVRGEPLAIYRDEAGQVTALSPVCTHMACEVGWNAAERTWDCPCHGGRFDAKGNVLDGPPNRPLKRRKLTQQGVPVTRKASSPLALTHGAFLLCIGGWSLLHLRSFAKVTGPKPEGWLAKAVGACLANVGLELLVSVLRHGGVDRAARALALRTAAAFAAFDFYYAGYRRRISPLYVLNGAAQLTFAGLWLAQMRADKALRRRLTADRVRVEKTNVAPFARFQ
jgi:glycine/D-amino acid oxidase-like deaminating enzyme/nitrite reductase/ring-hydroxylating ferredoxin subunit